MTHSHDPSTLNAGAQPHATAHNADTVSALPQRVLIAGGSGLIGSHLAKALHEQGCQVSIVGRDTAKIQQSLPFAAALSWEQLQHSDQALTFDAIINLAGHSIAAGRWSDANKARLMHSRVSTTQQLVTYCVDQAFAGVFINASAIGYYGDQGDQTLTEEATPLDCFSHALCAAWEDAVAPLKACPAIRICIARFGVVMASQGGAFAQMALPFKAKVAVQNGNGNQWFSWVGLNDATRALQFLMRTASAQGVFNVVAPQPLTNKALTQQLGAHYNTVLTIPAPAAVLRLAMGQMADELLLASQRVVPHRLTALGFTFSCDEMGAWLTTLK